MEKEIQFNSGSSIYWSNKLKCEFLQRYIIIHSIIYYELNKNIISDKQFDIVSKQLLKLQRKTENYNKTQYYYVFKDFDGNTGFYIWDRLNKKDKEYLKLLANNILQNAKQQGRG